MWKHEFFHLYPYSANYYVKADSFALIYLTFQTYQLHKLTTSNKGNACDNREQGNEIHLQRRSLSCSDIFRGVS